MTNTNSITTAITWCLAWGSEKEPQFDLPVLQQMQQALKLGEEVSEELKDLVAQVKQLPELPFPQTVAELQHFTEIYPQLWNSEIGLVYGGATKIKQYVFEAAKLPDIRGASALLDRINLIDLPAFFGKGKKSITIFQWLGVNFPGLADALIPELVIYSTGGNILAFCPAAFVDDLANAIERRYTEETLTANSCAVGDIFKPLEIRLGLLPNQIEETFWLEKYNQNLNHALVKAYFEQTDVSSQEAFEGRKSFNELAGKLASLFNQRRSGNDCESRPSRRYPPMFETHPYLIRDEGDRRSAVMKAEGLPNTPWFSESLARKRIVGQIAKRGDDISQGWYKESGLNWNPRQIDIPSWVKKFEDFLKDNELENQYYNGINKPDEARSLIEIGNASQPNGFVSYIYADGNNMGGYIQKIKSPQQYKQFSKDIFKATEESVYLALAEHLHPHQINNIKDEEKANRNGCWIHPFEILTIGGDDVMLIVPADKALAIAKTIGEEFEKILSQLEDYQIPPRCLYHRYKPQLSTPSECKLSMSTGVLITADDTPIYYAEKLTEQLLKSAKKQAKELKKKKYYGGTVDFLVMKSVTMISSNINEFRAEGLTKFTNKQQKLKLYAAPYTLHELGGLLETAKALKNAEFPRSQLYQIRSLLERGKQTAILNYRYFRVRLSDKYAQKLLKTEFEDAWCQAKSNDGNLAPWMSLQEEKDKVTYETIWRELVDLYPFIAKEEDDSALTRSQTQTSQP